VSQLSRQGSKHCVIALHCSLGSGRRGRKLAEELGQGIVIAGYFRIWRQLADRAFYDAVDEIGRLPKDLGDRTDPSRRPFLRRGRLQNGNHLAIASRIRSLTLIEPVLPTLLRENAADSRLHDLFANLGRNIYVDLWNGMQMEALDKFLLFWNGSGPGEKLSGEARLRMIEQIEKVAFDFTAILGEQGVSAAAASLRVPTLLYSGGLSPYLTQRIVGRLASIIPGAEAKHLPAAGTCARFLVPDHQPPI
jgi:hypothetical protein